MTKTGKLSLLISILLLLLAFWDNEYMKHIRGLVVLIHEVSHALAALFTGGLVEKISIHSNNSGETIAVAGKGSFLFIVSAGYLGSSFAGGFLLNRGLKDEHVKPLLLGLGLILAFLSFFYSSMEDLAFITGIAWGTFFFLSGLFGGKYGRYLLIFIGTCLGLYSVYDLFDFIGNIHLTDAGILASYLLGKPPMSEEIRDLGYIIALLWSFISCFLLYAFISNAMNIEDDKDLGLEEMLEQVNRGNVQPEVADWFLNKGLDLDGKPLTNETIKKIYEVKNKHHV
ncbi:MAG: M50 family metallopeptidase [Leptospiraceae bacterium]|nr:M50 family metallopeptidase [Leptospiraceae bacterium]MCP5503079.1 M50 family metallopeptidase [Leptospiraceae bacterium]